MDTNAKNRLNTMRHAQTIQSVLDILAESAADGSLYDLLLECNHDYIVDSLTRGYMSYIIHASTIHGIDLAGGLIRCRLTNEVSTIPADLDSAINEIMEGMFDSQDDMDRG